ncbi:hypothetical protein FYZ38_07665 [Mobiluncus curtisii]|nr:hypothetical protein [Mobiluncus curtisii]
MKISHGFSFQIGFFLLMGNAWRIISKFLDSTITAPLRLPARKNIPPWAAPLITSEAARRGNL